MPVCQACQRETAEGDLIMIEGRQVCAACKPLLVQQLKEGCLDAGPELAHDFGQRELGLMELMATSWRIFQRDWLAILALQLLAAIPINLILVGFDPGDEPTFREAGWYICTSILLEMVIGVVAALGIAKVVDARIRGSPLSFGQALGHTVRVWLPGIWTNLLATIIITLGLLLLIAPGVIYFVFYGLALPAVALRGCSGMRALSFSKALIQGRWWNVAGRLLGFILLPFAGAFLIGIATELAPESTFLRLGTDILSNLFFCWYHLAAAVLFLNLEAVVYPASAESAASGAR